MEPSWTEPPSHAWVFIRVRERRLSRRRSDAEAVSRSERRCSKEDRFDEEHHAQAGWIVRSEEFL